MTDTGRLYNAGHFRLGERGGCLRYWAVDTGAEGEPVLAEAVWEPETAWKADKAYRVIADFPERFFARSVACKVDAWGKGDTTMIWMWIVDDRP